MDCIRSSVGLHRLGPKTVGRVLLEEMMSRRKEKEKWEGGK
jgi:hypothetical protein